MVSSSIEKASGAPKAPRRKGLGCRCGSVWLTAACGLLAVADSFETNSWNSNWTRNQLNIHPLRDFWEEEGGYDNSVGLGHLHD